LAVTVGALVALAGFLTSNAGADGFGQLAGWGELGTGDFATETPTQLFGESGSAFGVDPSTGDVYVLDSNTALNEYRLQKFTSSGTFIASAKIPRPKTFNSEVGEETQPLLTGIAIDDTNHRVYLLAQQLGGSSTQPFSVMAEKVLVFSTEANGTELHGLGGPGGPTDLVIPGLSSSATAMEEPSALAVDPSSGDLLVYAYSAESGDSIITRFTVSGSPLALTQTERFDEPERHFPRPAIGMAVSPDGSELYLASPGNGTVHASVFKMSAKLSTAAVPTAAFQSPLRGGSHGPLGGRGGSGLALASDGETLYLAEEDARVTPAVKEVRGLSLVDGSTRSVFGGGTSGCKATEAELQLGAGPAGEIFAFDASAGKILGFGPGGNECPAPSLSFTVNGSSDQTVEVPVGAEVVLDSSSSEFKTTAPESITWAATGPEPFTKVVAPATAKTLGHTFKEAGTYTVSMNTQLTPDTFGASWSAPSKTIVVKAAPSSATPTVTAVSPNHGPAAGGTSVRITGTNLTGATAVRFGAANATAVQAISATEVMATSPAGAASTRVDVTVTTPAGASAVSAGDGFTYDAASSSPGDGGGGGGGGGGSTSPSPSPSPAPTPNPKPKPKPKKLVCKKGFKKAKVHGKSKCVKVAKKHKHKGKH